MLRRFFKILFYSCIAGILTGTILLIACVIAIDKKWSPLIESRVRERQSIGSVKVLASNEDGKGVWIGSLTSGRYEERQALTLAEMPPLLAQSVVVLEDPRFLIHGGFDIWGILRAAVVNLKSLRISQGGSTITQQLVKNIFLSREKTMTRKFTELVIAALVEKRFSKDEILEAYLNEVYMGQLGPFEVHGVGRGSEYYFSKKVSELSLAEVTLLAAIIKGPNYYSPWRAPERTLRRRNKVLKALLDADLIVKEEYETALNTPLVEGEKPKGRRRMAAYAMDAIRHELMDLYGEEKLAQGGFDVHSSIDIEMQELAEKSLKNFAAKMDKNLQFALIGANPQNCEIKFYVGGKDYRYSQLDRLRQSKRSIGSLMKPLELFTSLDTEDDTNLNLVIEDQPLTWNFDKNRGNWSPKNYDKKFRGKVTLRQSLEQSLNVPIVRYVFDRFPSGVLGEFFQPIERLGMRIPEKRALPSAILGVVEQRPLDVLRSYVNFLRLGLVPVDEEGFCENLKLVKDDPGNWMKASFEEEESSEEKNGVIGARLVVSALQGALRRGTSRWLGGQLPTDQAWAGKTGTSSDKKDAWYIALSPSLIVLGWAGRDDNKKTDLTGSSGALPLVSQMVLHQAHKVNQGVSWDWPVFEEHLQWKVLQKENHCIPDSDIEEYLAEKLLEDANPYGPSGLPKVVMYRGQEYYLELLKKSSKLKRCDGSDASIEDNAFKKLLKKIF